MLLVSCLVAPLQYRGEYRGVHHLCTCPYLCAPLAVLMAYIPCNPQTAQARSKTGWTSRGARLARSTSASPGSPSSLSARGPYCRLGCLTSRPGDTSRRLVLLRGAAALDPSPSRRVSTVQGGVAQITLLRSLADQHSCNFCRVSLYCVRSTCVLWC